MFNVQGFYRSKGTLSNLTSRTDWNLPGSSGTLRVNTSEPSRAPQVTRTIQTSPKSSCGNSCNPPRSPTSSFSNSPIPLEPSNCTPELCRTLRSFCNIALQSLKIRTFLLQSFKKNANLAAVAWSMTSMSTLNPFPMAGTEDCQLMGGTIDCCPLRWSMVYY